MDSLPGIDNVTLLADYGIVSVPGSKAGLSVRHNFSDLENKSQDALSRLLSLIEKKNFTKAVEFLEARVFCSSSNLVPWAVNVACNPR